MKRFSLVVIAALCCGFTMDDAEKKVFYGRDARLAVEAFGFTDVKITGPALYGCGRDYTIANEFSAVGPRSHKVKGIACGAFIVKGWSIKIWEVLPPDSEK